MKKIFIFSFFLLFSHFIFSQSESNDLLEKKPLNSILDYIQDEFKIFISYNAKIVASKSMAIPKKLENLRAILDEIQKQTGLIFIEINHDNYILKEKSNEIEKVCGYILDSKTKLPIANAFITSTDSQIQTNSTDSGSFELYSILEDAILTIKLLGYEPKEIFVKDFIGSNCINVYLEEITFDLEQVIIKSYLNSGVSKNRDGSLKIVPKKTYVLPGVGRSDILQGLQLIPGIQSPDETATGLNIRGGTPDQNLILWDGIKLYQNDHFFGMISAINSQVIDKIKLYRNGAPAKYGNHLSAIIDIKSDTKIPEKVEGSLGVNMLYGDLDMKIPLSKRTGVFFSLRKSVFDVLETITFDKFSEHVFQNTRVTTDNNNEVIDNSLSKTNTTFYFTDFTAKILSNINKKNTLSVSSIYFKNSLDFLSQLDEIDQRTEDYLDIENIGFNISWKKYWNPKFETNLQLNYSSYDYNYYGKEIQSNFFEREIIKENYITDSGFDLFTKYDFNNSHQIVNGLNWSLSDVIYLISDTSDIVSNVNFSINPPFTINSILALYNEYHYTSEKWLINAGLRTDYSTSFSQVYLQPRVSIATQLSGSFKLNLSAETQYQSINQIIEFQTENFGLQNQVWNTSGDSETPILKSNQISFNGSYVKNNWLIDAETYYKNIKNISSLSNGFNENINGISFGQSSVYGIDILIKKRFKNFSSLLSYSLTENTFTFPELNNARSFRGNFDIRHYLTFIQSVNFKNLKIALGWKYRTSRPYTPAFGLNGGDADTVAIIYEEINSGDLSDYHRLDFSVDYTLKPFKNSKINTVFSFSLLNVYNQKNILNRTYDIILDPNEAVFQLRETDKISLSRTPNFSFRLEF